MNHNDARVQSILKEGFTSYKTDADVQNDVLILMDWKAIDRLPKEHQKILMTQILNASRSALARIDSQGSVLPVKTP